jgi:ATP-dependent Clp protease protease subunit
MTRMSSAPYAASADAHTDPVLERLLRHRIIHIGTSITSRTADRVTAQLLLLAAESDAPVTLYINSPGGSVPAGLSIYDAMQHVRNHVITIGLGYCASMAQFLLAAGSPGLRFALPHTRMMLHLPSFNGTTPDTGPGGESEELRHARHQMAYLIARHTNRTVEEAIRDFRHDNWYSTTEAKQYGLIDDVLRTAPHPSGLPSRRTAR